MSRLVRLLSFLRRAFLPTVGPEVDEPQTVALLKGLKSEPSLLGDAMLFEEMVHPSEWTEAQHVLSGIPEVDPLSDMMDHIPTYHPEECQWVRKVLTTLAAMSLDEVLDEAHVRKALPDITDLNKMENIKWDPRKRQAVLQIKRQFATARPKRLVMVPLVKTHDVLAPLLRHIGKPFQGCHMTITEADRAVEYLDLCDEFIMTVWVVGANGEKVTQSGTGFRSRVFPGAEAAPDYANRLLIRGNLSGALLQEAYDDFMSAYTLKEDMGEKDHRVPILLQMQDMLRLSPTV